MQILIIGNPKQEQIIREKVGEKAGITSLDQHDFSGETLHQYDLVFDFVIEESPELFGYYEGNHQTPVLLNSPKFSLAELTYLSGNIDFPLFGFNGLPYFAGLEKMEISMLHQKDADLLANLMSRLEIQYLTVADRVGMATARVICMIINEAYYTLQEGTASKPDIDLGMRLGTNYPYGPFEWAQLIGLDHVYELLEALYEDTKDERYKVCPLLKREFLMTEV